MLRSYYYAEYYWVSIVYSVTLQHSLSLSLSLSRHFSYCIFLLPLQIELTPSLGVCLIKVMHNPREGGREIFSHSPSSPPSTVWEPQNIFEKPLALFKMQRNATLEMQSMRIKFPACCQRNCRAAGRGGREVGR